MAQQNSAILVWRDYIEWPANPYSIYFSYLPTQTKKHEELSKPHPFSISSILNLNNRFNSETSWPNNKAALPTNSPLPAASPATPRATTRAKATPSTPTTTNTPAPMSTASARGTASTSTPMAIAMRGHSWPIRSTASVGSPPRRRASTTVREGWFRSMVERHQAWRGHLYLCE